MTQKARNPYLPPILETPRSPSYDPGSPCSGASGDLDAEVESLRLEDLIYKTAKGSSCSDAFGDLDAEVESLRLEDLIYKTAEGSPCSGAFGDLDAEVESLRLEDLIPYKTTEGYLPRHSTPAMTITRGQAKRQKKDTDEGETDDPGPSKKETPRTTRKKTKRPLVQSPQSETTQTKLDQILPLLTELKNNQDTLNEKIIAVLTRLDVQEMRIQGLQKERTQRFIEAPTPTLKPPQTMTPTPHRTDVPANIGRPQVESGLQPRKRIKRPMQSHKRGLSNLIRPEDLLVKGAEPILSENLGGKKMEAPSHRHIWYHNGPETRCLICDLYMIIQVLIKAEWLRTLPHTLLTLQYSDSEDEGE